MPEISISPLYRGSEAEKDCSHNASHWRSVGVFSLKKPHSLWLSFLSEMDGNKIGGLRLESDLHPTTYTVTL